MVRFKTVGEVVVADRHKMRLFVDLAKDTSARELLDEAGQEAWDK